MVSSAAKIAVSSDNAGCADSGALASVSSGSASSSGSAPSSSGVSASRCERPAPAPLWTRNFVAGTFLNFFIAGNYFMLMVVMTAYALTVYQAPAAVAAFCASAFIVGTLFSRFAAAPMMERFGRMPLLVAGCLAEVALSALYLLNEPVGALIGVRLAHGFSYGVCSTTIATVITSVVPPERKGEGIGYFMLSITLGSAIGPFAGIFLANNFGYPVVFAVASVLVALSIPAALLLRPVPSTRVKGRAAAAEAEVEAAADVAAAAVTEAPDEEAREDAAADRDESFAAQAHTARASAEGAGAPTVSAVPANVSTRVPSTHLEEKVAARVEHSPLARFVEAGVLPISLVCGLLFFGYSSLLTFLTPYATEIGLARAASVFFVVYALAMFVTRPFTGRAFDRVGPHPVMVPAFVSFACGMVMLAFASNDWMILGAAALLGFGVGTVQSCGLAMAVRVTSDARLSVANATFYMLLDVGVGIGPILLGVVAPLMGYANLYLCMAVVGVLALALFLVVARTEKGVR